MSDIAQSMSWVHPGLVAGEAPSGGRGLFATVLFAKDETLMMCGGWVMTLEQERHLPAGISDFAHQIDDDLVIGARCEEEIGLSDLVNHSCDPNAGWKGQLRLVAMRDILVGEQITTDYAMMISSCPSAEPDYDFECRCGAVNCRGRMTSHDWLMPDLRKRYRGYFQEYLEQKISAEGGEL